jgi:hypothetical protein
MRRGGGEERIREEERREDRTRQEKRSEDKIRDEKRRRKAHQQFCNSWCEVFAISECYKPRRTEDTQNQTQLHTCGKPQRIRIRDW